MFIKLLRFTAGVLLMIAGIVLIVAGLLIANNTSAARDPFEERLKNATVSLMSCSKKGKCSTGTGFVVRQDMQGAFIISNKHVCMGALLPKEERDEVFVFRPMSVKNRSGKIVAGTIVRVGQNTDLCLIRTQSNFKSTLRLANSVIVGEKLKTYGFPAGKATLRKGKFTKNTRYGYGFYSQTDLKVWYGASGSAVINDHGEVVGVISNIFIDGNKNPKDPKSVIFSLMVPLEILRDFIGEKP